MKLIILSKKTLITLAIVLILLVTLFMVYMIYNRVEATFNKNVYYEGNVDEKVLAFACNIDWGNESIPNMLKIFNDNNIKITFFPTGKWAEKNPDILKDIYKNGHEIGNHGYNHLDYDKLSYEQNKEEISKSHNIIKDILNIEAKYFAPPSGAFSDNTIKASNDLGYDLILWSIDTIDWRQDSVKSVIVDRVISNAHNSAIVLMHPKEETVKALPEIINYLHENGYKVGTISDVLKGGKSK